MNSTHLKIKKIQNGGINVANKIAEINQCNLRESQCAKIFEIAEFELNLSETPRNTPSWIENFQISRVRFEFSDPKNLKKPQSGYFIRNCLSFKIHTFFCLFPVKTL